MERQTYCVRFYGRGNFLNTEYVKACSVTDAVKKVRAAGHMVLEVYGVHAVRSYTTYTHIA